MATPTSAAPVPWADAAAHGTRAERVLVGIGRLFIRAAADSARRRVERREMGEHWGDSERDRMRADAVRLGVLRR